LAQKYLKYRILAVSHCSRPRYRRIALTRFGIRANTASTHRRQILTTAFKCVTESELGELKFKVFLKRLPL
jgi:hypothetical protein